MASVAYPYDGAPVQATPAPLISTPIPAVPILFVIPAYNEEENLPRLFGDLEARLELFPEGSRVIIVDDGSDDRTAALASEYRGPVPVEVVSLSANQGPGGAFRSGFDAALATEADDALIVTLEADTTSDLDVLPTMLTLAAGGADLVLASVHGGGRMMNVGLGRRLMSAWASRLTRLMLGLDAHTVSSFFRVYRAEILRAGRGRYGDRLIEERGFACKAELLAKLAGLGARVEEVPVDLDASRRIGPSKMPVGRTLAGYWRLMLRRRPEKGFEAA